MNPANRQNRTFEYQGEYGAFLNNNDPSHRMVWDSAKNMYFVLGCGNEVISYVDFLITDQTLTKNEPINRDDCCGDKKPQPYTNLGLLDDWSTTGGNTGNSGIGLAPLNQQNLLLTQQINAEEKRKYKLFFGAGETTSGFVNILEGAIRWGLIAFGGYLIYDWISDMGNDDARTPRAPNPDPNYNPGDSARGLVIPLGGK